MKYARAIALLLAAAFTLTAAAASAQTYPNRPITLVVPFPAGGATDAIARIIQDSMSQSLGQQVVIENIGGAGGMIAAARAARAAPDGYTILMHQVGAGGRHDDVQEPVVRRRKGFRRDRPHQHRRFDLGGPPDAAAEHYGRAGEVDEGAWTERQGRACRRRLVRSSVPACCSRRTRRNGHDRFPIAAADLRSTIWWPATST